ncbi:MAG: T9SS type A sorting domain-containing protein [Bacteroidota bacterium]|jgi:hypothetical protein
MKRAFIAHTLLLLAVTAGLSMSQSRIERSVLSGGATRAGNTSWIINGTVGQAIIGTPKSASRRGSFGFWFDRNSISTDVERIASAVPSSIVLEQNYPNPAVTTTTIRFSIPTARNVLLVVTDALGRTLNRVADGPLDAGSYKTDIQVLNLPAGTYFYRLHAGDEQLSRKFVVLR